jgi:hypothetical protein
MASATDDGFHCIGYALALNGPNCVLDRTNQNTTLQPEVVANFPSTGESTKFAPAERVLIADAIICPSGDASEQGGKWTGKSWNDVEGGFEQNGKPYDHLTPHLNKIGQPAGGNIGFKDGHVQWRVFSTPTAHMTPRTDSGTVFWW